MVVFVSACCLVLVWLNLTVDRNVCAGLRQPCSGCLRRYWTSAATWHALKATHKTANRSTNSSSSSNFGPIYSGCETHLLPRRSVVPTKKEFLSFDIFYFQIKQQYTWTAVSICCSGKTKSQISINDFVIVLQEKCFARREKFRKTIWSRD